MGSGTGTGSERPGPRAARRLLVLLAAALAATGCAHVSRFEKGPFVAFGEPLHGSPEPLYYLLRLDLTDADPDEAPLFSVQLATDTPPIAWHRLTPSLVAAHLPPFVPPAAWPERRKAEAARRTAFEGGGCHVAFLGERLEFLSLFAVGPGPGAAPDPAPAIGSADGIVLRRLPLTEAELIEAVGEPDRILRVREVTY